MLVGGHEVQPEPQAGQKEGEYKFLTSCSLPCDATFLLDVVQFNSRNYFLQPELGLPDCDKG